MLSSKVYLIESILVQQVLAALSLFHFFHLCIYLQQIRHGHSHLQRATPELDLKPDTLSGLFISSYKWIHVELPFVSKLACLLTFSASSYSAGMEAETFIFNMTFICYLF